MLRMGPLIGRESEVNDALERLRCGKNVAFRGPAGVGKSTIARTIMRRLQREGVSVEWWSAIENDGSPRGLGDALERLLGSELTWNSHGGATGLEEPPERRSPARALSLRYASWVQHESERLLQEIPLSGTNRPILFIDDLRNAPTLIQALVKGLYRISDSPEHPLRMVWVDGPEDIETVQIGALSRTSAQAVVATRLGSSVATERLGSVLAAASGGNPREMESLLALLVERQELVYQNGAWRLTLEAADIRLPANHVAALRERMSLLSPACKRHLGAIAWIGFPSLGEHIEAVLNEPCDWFAVRELDAAGLLWQSMNGEIAAGHSVVRDLWAAWIPPGGAGQAKQRLLACTTLSAIARAWHEGGDVGCRRALEWSEHAWNRGDLHAADEAVRIALHCNETSITALRQAARVANLLGPREWQVQCLEVLRAQGESDDFKRLGITADLFWALTRIGDTGRAEEIGQVLLTQADHLGQVGIYVDALVHMANTRIQQGDYSEGRRYLEEARSRAEDPPTRARILNNLGNVERYEGNLEQALQRYHEAYVLKCEEGDPIGTRIALGNMGLICFELGRYNDALEAFTKSRIAAVETGHLRGEAFSLLGLSLLGLKGGVLSYASKRAAQALDIANKLGDRVVAWDARSTLAQIAYVAGDEAEALTIAEAALAEYSDIENPYNEAGTKSLRAMALRHRDPATAERLAIEVLDDRLVKDTTIRSHGAWVRCELALDRGDLDGAGEMILVALKGEAWKIPLHALETFLQAARMVGDPVLIESVNEAVQLCLERGQQWPEEPWKDGLEEDIHGDGPSLGSYNKQPAVMRLRGISSRRRRGSAMAESISSEKSTWIERLAGADADTISDCLVTYTVEMVQKHGAERGFILDASGVLRASADADGEAVVAAKDKVPEGVVSIVSKTGAVYRADSSSGTKGSLCAIPAFAADRLVGVLVLQNRFVPDAFSRVAPQDVGDSLLGLIFRVDELHRGLASAQNALSTVQVETRREQTRSTEEILRLRRELESTRELLSPEHEYGEIIFQSNAMKKMLRRLDRVIDSALPVYVHGESGSGKELVAKAIHAHGARAKGPFVAQNCSAVPRALFESEFFGHEKGAFTGADRASDGLFRRASGGTLFLDEIGDLPLDHQAKLLRVLETGEVRSVGGQKNHSVDVRIICATHRDLGKQVQEKRFREDLFYRLNVVRVDVPPLRNRPEDIPLLVSHFMDSHSRTLGDVPELKKGVMKALVTYDWPGNVRQLENEVIRAMLLSDGTIQIEDLSPEIRQYHSNSTRAPEHGESVGSELGGGTLKERVDRLEYRVLRGTLEKYGGNKSKVARELGLSRAGLNMKLKRLELWKKDEE